MADNIETELWEAIGGTGVAAHRYAEADFDDETIEIRIGVHLHISTAGVIPDDRAAGFWRTFWEGASPEHKKEFRAVLAESLQAAFPWDDAIDWMERADELLKARFEECGGRQLEVPRESVPDDDLDGDLDECRVAVPA